MAYGHFLQLQLLDTQMSFTI